MQILANGIPMRTDNLTDLLMFVGERAEWNARAILENLPSREPERSHLVIEAYRMFHEQGIICVCNTCGEKNYCACDIVTGTSECFNCAVKRIEREERAKEQLKNFNYEDFIRL